MKIFNKEIKVALFKLILMATAVVILFLCYFVFVTDSTTNPRLSGILIGLLTGFIVGLFQLLLSWYEHREINRLKRMKIINVMLNRDQRDFYERLIKESKSEIYVMGVTASRFKDHFADLKSAREECKVLLSAMTRGVKVKLLLPDPKHLNNDEKQLAENQLKAAFAEIKTLHPNFEYRYFDHPAAHSIFVVDKKCIIGPVFPSLSSRDTPAIIFAKSSEFAQKYLDYFNTEWTNAI